MADLILNGMTIFSRDFAYYVEPDKRICFIWTNAEGRASPTLADAGCFVVYSVHRRRFMVPLACLSNSVLKKLLEMSEEEYGLSSDGPIIMPCNSALLGNIVTLIGRGESKTLEKVLFDAVDSNRSCALHPCDEATIQQLAVPIC